VPASSLALPRAHPPTHVGQSASGHGAVAAPRVPTPLITTEADELREGLFGQIILWTFETLPQLDAAGIRPAWAIRSRLYGAGPDPVVVPGLLDIAYPTSTSDVRPLPLAQLRASDAAILGNDWPFLSDLWKRYFRLPARIEAAAQCYPDLQQALGLHYRGTDKNRASEETNPISADEFLTLVEDFVRQHPAIRTLYVASDEPEFLVKVGTRLPHLELVASGIATHHKDPAATGSFAKGDHALLDCLLLSRCRYVLKCQSALSGFAKILNPDLEIYRVSANKLAHWSHGIPYFPDAYLPPLTSADPTCQRLLARLMAGDWTQDALALRRYGGVFRFRRRPAHLREGHPAQPSLQLRLQRILGTLWDRLIPLIPIALWRRLEG
jgi:hypothetical protein